MRRSEMMLGQVRNADATVGLPCPCVRDRHGHSSVAPDPFSAMGGHHMTLGGKPLLGISSAVAFVCSTHRIFLKTAIGVSREFDKIKY